VTTEWQYWITTQGWDQSAPLAKSSFEHLRTIAGNNQRPPSHVNHDIVVPSNRQGYHIIMAIWDIGDTTAAFFNAIDVYIHASDNAQVGTITPGDNGTTGGSSTPGHNGGNGNTLPGGNGGQTTTPPITGGGTSTVPIIRRTGAATISWPAVTGATSYDVHNNGDIVSLGNALTKTLPAIHQAHGTRGLNVRAIVNGVATAWSSTIGISFNHANQPQGTWDEGNTGGDIIIDDKDDGSTVDPDIDFEIVAPIVTRTGNFITWFDRHQDVDSYELRILDGNKLIASFDVGYTLSYEFVYLADDLDIQVRAVYRFTASDFRLPAHGHAYSREDIGEIRTAFSAWSNRFNTTLPKDASPFPWLLFGGVAIGLIVVVGLVVVMKKMRGNNKSSART
jgi:hypothetical protein